MMLISLLEDILGSDNLILLDKLFGFRAWGLILYSVISTILLLLGISNLKISSFNNLSNTFLITISIPLIILLALSVKHQNQKWYLTTSYLYFRSTILTIIILLLSTSIVWIYEDTNNPNLETTQNSMKVNPMKCLIIATLSLLIPSAFFVSSLTSKLDLPGLPSNSFVTLIEELYLKMRELIKIKTWKNYTDYDQNFMNLIKEIETVIDRIDNLKGNSLAKKSISGIKYDIVNLMKGFELISLDCEDCKSKNEYYWKSLFDNSNNLSKGQERIRKKNKPIFESIQRIKCLKIGE